MTTSHAFTVLVYQLHLVTVSSSDQSVDRVDPANKGRLDSLEWLCEEYRDATSCENRKLVGLFLPAA